jgi:hypothetical protein
VARGGHGCHVKAKKSTFRQDKFRKAVLDLYNASRNEIGDKMVWCHALYDWFLADQVKAAYLVPKSLSLTEADYLFGIEEVLEDFFYNWKLGKNSCYELICEMLIIF